ncbi:PSP1 C-terminal conserved region-domain-containing protein [Roridomyces roridus]|uniref:PSP1 C-terminal conserved region-domain-containing protein n=1 Tax=Roridomyces roridus TaxID=1738132 RepID=A0AAD7B671_9AGAR|nr:PSP1 C-terminal conserved region-domain-containing protein [Roridomyces roridus]
MSRSRSQSLATAAVGQGRLSSLGSAGGGGGGGGLSYGELPGSRYGSLGSLGLGLRDSSVSSTGRRREEDLSNMSPFVRDVGQILLDDGGFRELWERERERPGPIAISRGGAGGGGGAPYESRPSTYTGGGGIGGGGRLYPGGLGAYESRPSTYTGAGARFHDRGLSLSSLSSSHHSHSSSLGGGTGAGEDPYEQYEGGGGSRVSPSVPRRVMSGFNAPEAATTPTVGSPTGVRPFGGSGGGGLLLSDDDLEGIGSLNAGMGSLGLGGGGGGGHAATAAYATGFSRGLSPTASSRVPMPQQAQPVKESWADAYFSPPRPQIDLGFASGYGGGGGPLSPLSPGGGAGRGLYQQQQPPQQQQPVAELGKGLPLHSVPPEWPLYIVEFKAGRTDLFYRAPDRGGKGGRGGQGEDDIRVGDLVIVEADRGKDLGKVVNDSITLGEVEAYWTQRGVTAGSGQSPPTSPGGAGEGKKEIAPKMIYGKAGAGDALLVAKMQDEVKALALCQTKVRAKKLPMEVVDAEYQWDRRKLTFYFVAEKRIDFRELVRELFRLYKTRIWMASLQGANGGGGYEQ